MTENWKENFLKKSASNDYFGVVESANLHLPYNGFDVRVFNYSSEHITCDILGALTNKSFKIAFGVANTSLFGEPYDILPEGRIAKILSYMTALAEFDYIHLCGSNSQNEFKFFFCNPTNYGFITPHCYDRATGAKLNTMVGGAQRPYWETKERVYLMEGGE